jgi:hypothetical protein
MRKGILIICLGFLAIGLGSVARERFWPSKVIEKPVNKVEVADLVNGSKLGDALKTGMPQMCVFNNKSGPVARTGTVYIYGLNIRTDYNLTEGKPGYTKGHLISNGEYFYIWTEQNSGFKIKVSEFSGNNATASAENLLRAFIAMDANSEIKCLSWQPDMTVYSVPTDVEFNDFTKQILDMKNTFNPPTNN